MTLFKLTLLTLWVRKTWIVILLAIILLPFVGPYIAPVEEAPKLLPPARAHTAWMVAWMVGILWGLSQGAKSGDGNARTGVGNLLRSMNVGYFRQMLGIWSALMVYLVPLVLIAMLISIFAAMPGAEVERGYWVATNLQFALLYLLTLGPLVLLAIGLASRFGSMVGYVVPGALCLYGLYGVGYLGETIKMGGNPLLEWVYIISPQYHLADLTPRLLFKMGALKAADFGAYAGYFLIIAVVMLAVSRLSFRTEPLRS
ncbi:hypothetical protein [Haloferula sp.]|uniref:hypothetical protein n=1 Tax=Haloferula sp. TaxID=2497595 RepID=UPI00329F83EC